MGSDRLAKFRRLLPGRASVALAVKIVLGSGLALVSLLDGYGGCPPNIFTTRLPVTISSVT